MTGPGEHDELLEHEISRMRDMLTGHRLMHGCAMGVKGCPQGDVIMETVRSLIALRPEPVPDVRNIRLDGVQPR